MNIPGFTAEASVYRADSDYVSTGFANSHGGALIPAIPFCGNCDYILDNCERNGWRPRALCGMCASGHCFSGVEKTPQLLDPYGYHPGGFF